MQRIDLKQQQDPQQQQQKLETIKKELQKYRELKKSPSLSTHLSVKQLQKCSETEKRKQILNFINTTQLEQGSINVSQTIQPHTSRNSIENQSILAHQKETKNDFMKRNSSNKFFQSATSREKCENHNLGQQQIDGNIYQENMKIASANNSKSSIISQNQIKETFREITLADVQNFDMENQQVYFNQLNNQGERDTNRHNKLSFINSEEQAINQKYLPGQSQIKNNPKFNVDISSNAQEAGDEEDYQQLTFDDLRVKHQGIYNFKDLNGQNNCQENNQSNNKKNLSLNNLEENYHQSSWASTLPSNRNEYEKNQQLILQNFTHKNPLHNFMTSQNTLTSQMSQKLHSIGSGRLNQSNLSSDQQIPTLKDCASTSTNSKPQSSSNQTLSSKTKFHSKGSQGYLDYVLPRNLNVRPESLEDISKDIQFDRPPLEEKESQKSIQNIMINNNQQKKNVYQSSIKNTNLNSKFKNQANKGLSLNTSKISPPVSPKNQIGKEFSNRTIIQSDTKKLTISASLSPNSKQKQTSKIVNNLNKENNVKQNSDNQDKKEDFQQPQTKYNKLNQIIQQKSSTTKNISPYQQQQPYFKSLKSRHEKTTSPKEISKTNTSNLKVSIPTSIPQEKSKQIQNVLKKTPQKQSQQQIQDTANNGQTPQISQLKEEDQLQEKQNFLIKRLTEEQQRWKEIGSQMVLAYEELNQNFKLLVKQKKQQDKMLQQLVQSLSQQENSQNKHLNFSISYNQSEFTSQISSHRDKEGENSKQQKSQEAAENQVQQLIAQIQSKLFSKFDNEDSQLIQSLLNQFNQTRMQNQELKQNQKDIQNIVNHQIKESSSLADQIIHLRTQLDKACISMMKNQKESNCQFSSMIQMLNLNKDNQILSQNKQNIFQQQESFNPDLATSIINQLNVHENNLIGQDISPINSVSCLNSQNQINKQTSIIPKSYNCNINYQEQQSENIFHTQNRLNLNIVQSQIRFSDYKDASYFKQQELIEDHKYSPILNKLNDGGYLQNESFQIVSPIRKEVVPFFGEMESKHILNSEDNEEIQFQVDCN